MQGVREGLGTKADSPARQHMPQHRHSLQACSSYPGKSAALCPKKGVFNSDSPYTRTLELFKFTEYSSQMSHKGKGREVGEGEGEGRTPPGLF